VKLNTQFHPFPRLRMCGAITPIPIMTLWCVHLHIYIFRKRRAFENWVLRRIFGPKRGELTGDWRKLHNEDPNNLYSSPNIVRVIKSSRMRWAGHVARIGTADV
jgi:hypothetical protein